MPLACAGRSTIVAATYPQTSIWISDAVLNDALHRFTLACFSVSSRPRPTHSRSAATSRTPAVTCPITQQKRRASSVPGPLEARRRLARRRLNYAAAGVQVGSGPVFDPEVLLGDLFGRPKQPYWSWEPPDSFSDRQRNPPPLPAWLLGAGPPPPPPHPVAGVEVEGSRAESKGSARENVDACEDMAPNTVGLESVALRTFKQRLRKTPNFKKVRLLLDSQDVTEAEASACNTAAFDVFFDQFCKSRVSGQNSISAITLSELIKFAKNPVPIDAAKYKTTALLKGITVQHLKDHEAVKIVELLHFCIPRHRVMGSDLMDVLAKVPEICRAAFSSISERYAQYQALLKLTFRNLNGDHAVDMSTSFATLKQVVETGLKSQDQDFRLAVANHATICYSKLPKSNEALKGTVISVALGIIDLVKEIELSSNGETVELICATAFKTLEAESATLSPHPVPATITALLQHVLSASRSELRDRLSLKIFEHVLTAHSPLDDIVAGPELWSLMIRTIETQMEYLRQPWSNGDYITMSSRPLPYLLLRLKQDKLDLLSFRVTQFFLEGMSDTNMATERLEQLNIWLSILQRRQTKGGSEAMWENIHRQLLSRLSPSQVSHALPVADSEVLCRLLLEHWIPRRLLESHAHIPALHGPDDKSIQERLGEDFATKLSALQTKWHSAFHGPNESHVSLPLETSYAAHELHHFGATVNQAITPVEKRPRVPRPSGGRMLPDIPSQLLQGALPFVALFRVIRTYVPSSQLVVETLEELILVLEAHNRSRLLVGLVAAARLILKLPFTHSIRSVLTTFIEGLSATKPGVALYLFTLDRHMTLSAIPSLIPAIIASPHSTIHPRRIRSILRNPRHNTLIPKPVYRLADRSTTIPPSLTDIIHDAALSFARAARFSSRTAWYNVHRLWRFLRDTHAPIDARISRAIVVAGVLRPIREGLCWKIAPQQFRFILDVVRLVEGDEIAQGVDAMARKAEAREAMLARGKGATEKREVRQKVLGVRSFGAEIATKSDAEQSSGGVGPKGSGWRAKMRQRERRQDCVPGAQGDGFQSKEQKRAPMTFRYI